MAEAGTVSDLDRRLMAVALRLGRRNLGQTAPNPVVGALVVQPASGEARIVGRGWTAAGGRPHAETEALGEAGEAARGATVYVTLEPCSHFGATPPCANALVRAGVRRVVTAAGDPDPRVAGRGHEILRQAGIVVATGVLEREARSAHAGHIARVTTGRPRVMLKLAVSADGMIGRRDGKRAIISGPAALDRVQAIRAEADAILVGVGTAIADDPLLTVRLPGMAGRSPIRVVLDSRARLPLGSRLVASARDVPLWVVVAAAAPIASRQALAERGAEIIEVPSSEGGLDLAAALAALGERGVTRLLVEGGAAVAAALVRVNLVDDAVLLRAPGEIGAGGVNALGATPLSAIEASPGYRLVEDLPIGPDRLRRYERAA